MVVLTTQKKGPAREGHAGPFLVGGDPVQQLAATERDRLLRRDIRTTAVRGEDGVNG